MKTIIAGSRTITDMDILLDAIVQSKFHISEVVCGAAKGADELGYRWGNTKGIPVVIFPANWRDHGKSAGPIRNDHMAEYGDALIAIWDGESKGTKHMISSAKKSGLKVYVHLYKDCHGTDAPIGVENFFD